MPTPTVIEIEGTYDGERYLVKIDSYPVRLTGKSFLYLTKLAYRLETDRRLKNSRAGWIYKEDIEPGVNQARYVYRLRGELEQAGCGDWEAIENNRLGYYRLRLPEGNILFNWDELGRFPDWTIQQLAPLGVRNKLHNHPITRGAIHGDSTSTD